MSLGIINKNTSSPFMLRRSIVDQGGQGGAYESGGFNPDQGYSDGGTANAIAALGNTIGAGLSARTAGDENKDDLAASNRLDKKSKRISEKISSLDIFSLILFDFLSNLLDKKSKRISEKISSLDTSEDKKKRLEKRLGNVGERKVKVESRINDYNEMVKPTLTSDIGKIKK